ncbi:GNAT family N-acetyltransferase [Kineococcus glutinatus]|uniref:GNAT family N-acetyltransferase n=1 Tax=Kineococcus glutinatus TaxID=1070872 RepID=A0ABP9HUA7_9ACTN
MDVTVTDVPERDRYEARAGAELLAVAQYERAEGLVVFTHTVVQPAHEGEGIGSTLVRAALDDVRRQGLRAVPRCPFVAAWVRRHREGYGDLVAADPQG